MFINFSNIVSFVKTRLRQKPLESRCLSLFVAFLVALVFHSNTKFLCFKTVGLPLKHQISLLQNSCWSLLSDFCTQGSQKSFLTIPPKKTCGRNHSANLADSFLEASGVSFCMEFKICSNFKSSFSASLDDWESRWTTIFQDGSYWGPSIKGKFKGGVRGSLPQKKLFGRSPGWGMSSPVFF